jgi:hypothetical protein
MEIPPAIHIFYIPGVFILGLIAGWMLRSKVTVKGEDEE